MKYTRGLFERMTFAADLPGESIPGMSLVELAGSRRVLVERHQGVTQYSCCEIRIKVSYGELCVCGTGLELAQMTKEQLVITGSIDTITLIKRGR